MSWLKSVRHFSPNDGGLHDPHGDILDERLMQLLDEAREEAGVPFVVTSGFRSHASNERAGGAPNSPHLADAATGKACAVDGFFKGWSVYEQLVHLLRFPFFGVAVYPYAPPGRDPKRLWTPVVHVDRKPRGRRFNQKVVWIRNAAGVYVYWGSDEFTAELRKIAHSA